MVEKKDVGIPDPVVTHVMVEMAAGYNLISREEFLGLPISERLNLILNNKIKFLGENGKQIPARMAVEVIASIQKFQRVLQLPEFSDPEKDRLVYHVIRTMDCGGSGGSGGGGDAFKIIQKNMWNCGLETIESLDDLEKFAKHLFRQKGTLSIIGQHISNTCLRVRRAIEKGNAGANVA